MNRHSNTAGFLLIEGNHFAAARDWFREHYPTHRALSLLINTPYAAIADVGPFLVEAPIGSPVHIDWWKGHALLNQGIWLDTRSAPAKLFVALQRRLKIRSSQDREYWLRLGDAAAMARVWQSRIPWPSGFWHGVDSVWLHHEGETVCAWQNLSPELDAAPANTGLQAQLVLSGALLEALSKENTDA